MANMVESKIESEARQRQEAAQALIDANAGAVAEEKNPFKLLAVILSVAILILAGALVFLVIMNNNREECPICDDSSDEPAVINVEGGPYIADGYFIVPRWNAKFKLTDALTDYGFVVLPNSLMSEYGDFVVGVTAVFEKDLKKDETKRYYATVDYCSFVTVSRTTSNMKDVEGPKKVVPFNSYTYVIHDFTTHGGCVDKGSGLMTKTYYGQVAERLTEVFSKPENLNVAE